MREKYYLDNRIYSFDSEIVSITQTNDKYFVELNDTYFYPEGGGQPGDIGEIDNCRVLDTKKVEGRVLHILSAKPVNKKVKCRIDKKHRDHYMVQHSGQHLISAVLKKELNIDTLSVHMGREVTTIEIDTNEITPTQIERVEKKVFDLISSGKSLIYHETNDEGLKEFNIRRESKYSGYIRVVEIEGYDFVPCGGVHLKHLYEIGLVKIMDFEKIRGNIRLNILIGEGALEDYRVKNIIINNLNRTLSTKRDGIINGIENLHNSIIKLKIEKKELSDLYIKNELAKIESSSEQVVLYDNVPTEISQKIATSLVDRLSEPLLIINRNTSINWYLIDSIDKKINFNTFKEELLPIISGKGGGKFTWQGSGNLENIDSFIFEFRAWVLKQQT